MDNPRPEKVAVVEEVRQRLDASSAAILTEYRGLSVKDLATLRRSLTAAGGTYKIYKNTLVGFAARDLGLSELEPMLQGPTAITFVQGDAVDVAKALRDFARAHPGLVVKGGLLGKSVLSSADAAALADLPPREVLLARFAGALAAPMVQFAGLLQALPRNLAYGLKALIEKKGGVPEVAAAAPDAPADTAPTAEADAPAATDTTPAPATAAGADAPSEDATPTEATPSEGARSTEAPTEGAGSTEAPTEGGTAPPDAAPPDAAPDGTSAEEPTDGASSTDPADPTPTTDPA